MRDDDAAGHHMAEELNHSEVFLDRGVGPPAEGIVLPDGVGHAPHVGRRVRGVVVEPNLLQIYLAAGLEVDVRPFDHPRYLPVALSNAVGWAR